MNLIIRNCVIALFDLKEVGGDFLFCSFDHILDRILVFCTKKFRFFGLVSVAVYVSVLFRSRGFRFAAKIKSSFRLCYSMHFSVFPVSLRKICPSMTSTAYTSSLFLLAVFGFRCVLSTGPVFNSHHKI